MGDVNVFLFSSSSSGPYLKFGVVGWKVYLSSVVLLVCLFKLSGTKCDALCSRDPMDMMFMEQHFLRSPLRLYADAADAENNNSLLMVEKARALGLWGYPGARVPMPWGQYPLLLPPQLTPPPPAVSTPSSSGSPSPTPARPAAVFPPPPQHRFSPYHLMAKGGTVVPTRN